MCRFTVCYVNKGRIRASDCPYRFAQGGAAFAGAVTAAGAGAVNAGAGAGDPLTAL